MSHTSFSVSMVERAACSFRILISPGNKLAACPTHKQASGMFYSAGFTRK